ncbi:hypothetical protein DRP07_00010 [Archaeoglobales archaeon]|nr:MAG: hypothetical protein DRP07_00010 [Archaeoglobales archaeon]
MPEEKPLPKIKNAKKIAVLLLIAAILLVAYTSFVMAEQNSNPGLAFVRGSRIRVPAGEEVTLYTTLKATGGSVDGYITVYVRKAWANWPDENYATLTKYISLSSGETKTFEIGTFTTTTNDITGEPWWAPFQHYFIVVYFEGVKIYDPTNPDTRECVETYRE